MAGVQRRGVGHLGQLLGERLVEGRGVAAGEVGAAAALQEEGVAGDEPVVDVEALAAGRVSRRVDQLDGDVADGDGVAAVVQHEVGLLGAGHPLHPRRLVALHVDRHGLQGEQLADAGDRVAPHRPADVVGVVVGGEGAGQAHAVGVEDGEQALDVVGGVDGDGLAGLPVADQVHEVDHLAGDGIGRGDVPPGEELAEVEAVGVRHSPAG